MRDPITSAIKEYYRFKIQYSRDVPPVQGKPEDLFKTTCNLFKAIEHLSDFPKLDASVEVKVELTYYGNGMTGN